MTTDGPNLFRFFAKAFFRIGSAAAIFAVVSACQSNKPIAYKASVDRSADRSQLACVSISNPVECNPCKTSLYGIVVELDGRPTPLAGIAREMPMSPGRHEMIVALLPKLTYNGTETGVKYYRLAFEASPNRRVRLRSQCTGIDMIHTWLEDQCGSAIAEAAELSLEEGDALGQRHREFYDNLEKSGKLIIR